MLIANASKWAVIALLVPIAYLYSVALAAPATGLYSDDGIYLVTAKALAEGRGYRILSTPDEMYQTKYPPLYPAALATVWAVWPRFPANLLALKIVSFGFLLGWLLLAYRYLTREMQVPATASLWIVALIAGTAQCVDAGALLLSEGLFGLLAYTALLAAARASQRGGRWWILAALAAVGAFYTRTAGLMLVPAIAAGLAGRRQFRRALAFIALAGMLSLGWPLWQRAHPTRHTSESARYHAKENYADWNLLTGNYSAADRLAIIAENLTYESLLPAQLFPFQRSKFFLIFAVLASAGLWICIFRGAWQVRAIIPALFAGLTLCAVLAWAWPPPRFCLPLLPLLAGFAYHGLPRIPRVGVTALAALALVLAMPAMFSVIARTGSAAQGFAIAPDWHAISKMHAWIKTNLPTDAIVGSSYDAALYLYTGHKSARFCAPNNRQFYSIAQQPVEQGARAMRANFEDWHMTYFVETGRDAHDDVRYESFKKTLNPASTQRCPLVIAPGFSVCQVAIPSTAASSPRAFGR